ncbi:MAG: Ig-like domain-containing protein [Woeseia sp.]
MRPLLPALLGLTLALSACGGGNRTAGTGGVTNRPPVANAGADQTVAELTTVILAGSATDPDSGQTLSYAWTQTAGRTVTLNNANAATANFVAPDVAPGAPELLTFQLSVSDGNGGNSSDTTNVTVEEPPPTVTISGKVRYQFVPPHPNCAGLNYGANQPPRPIRQATVQVVDAGTRAVIDSAVSDNAGDYAFTISPNTMVFLRVRAELIRSGAIPSWNVEVRNNTANTGSPLAQRPLYVLDSAPFDSGLTDSTRNLTAATGWNGSGYTPGARAAAPFAILDAIFSGMSAVLAADPQANFPPLDAFWSVNNSTVQGAGTFDENVASGEIGNSFYTGDKLFLLGKEDDDTEEFDDHVVVHEWGHYFEDNFSRSDSIGGPHGLGDSLDMRLAFGEGWATAFSGIGLNNAIYCDTGGPGQGIRQLRIDIENGRFGTEGWYNEISVMNLLYDLWDTRNDGLDTGSLGFGPIYDVLTGTQVGSPAFTSIFSFAAQLKLQNPAQAAFINTLLGDHNITGPGMDIHGSNEANDHGGVPDVLPVHTTIVPDGSTIPICSNEQFDGNFDGNKLSTHRFLRMTVTNPSPLTFTVITTTAMPNPDDPADVHDQSDPDLRYYLNGQIQNRVVGNPPVIQGLSGDANQEIFTTPNVVAAGDYVIDLHEFRYEDDMSPANYPSRTCFDVTISP